MTAVRATHASWTASGGTFGRSQKGLAGAAHGGGAALHGRSEQRAATCLRSQHRPRAPAPVCECGAQSALSPASFDTLPPSCGTPVQTFCSSFGRCARGDISQRASLGTCVRSVTAGGILEAPVRSRLAGCKKAAQKVLVELCHSAKGERATHLLFDDSLRPGLFITKLFALVLRSENAFVM